MEKKVLLSLLFINFVYVICGGMIFHLLEGPKEELSLRTQKDQFRVLKDAIHKNFSCISMNELDVLLEQILESYEEGELQSENNTNLEWDIDGSIFFATTVITTIGYGHIAPSTSGGRVFCIFYALIGIPLCLVALGGLGKKLSNLAASLDKKLNKGIFPEKIGKVVRTFMLFIVGFCVFILMPAGLFLLQEEWSYGDAIYYGIITLTTVGLGDFVAGVEPDKRYGWWYHICVAVWIWLGLSWAATVISAGQEVYESFLHPDGEELQNFPPEDNNKDKLPLVENVQKISYTEPTKTEP